MDLIHSDVIQRLRPDAVQIKGLVGQRFEASRLKRLHRQEKDHLLWPFHKHCPVGLNHPNRPYPQIHGDWQGEFIGTWIDAACLTAWNTGDVELHRKINAMVDDWLSTQQEDGYLGTYDEEDRWKSWDVWVQAHDIIGLLSYYWHTGSDKGLNAAVRVADRVLRDFGPGRRYLHETGPFGGMASSAILEPLIWLYWEIGDKRYLDFGRWLVDEDWEAKDGPRLVSSLVARRGVAGVPYPKGIEMLIDFAGMVELYRATGDEHYLKPVLIAWEDIVQHHLYLTGSASTGEFFTKDYTLPNDGVYMVGETCVSMGWLYLNLSLGRLLGEARFFDMAEQTLYNHLLGAQSPDGRGWAYYVGLRDSKRYRWHTDPECCPSRGVRALAHIPQHVFGVGEDGLFVNFYEPAEARLMLPSGAEVRAELAGNYPFDSNLSLKLEAKQQMQFTVRLRLPGWCRKWRVSINGTAQDIQPNARGYLSIRQVWHPGDMIELKLEMPVHIVEDKLGNIGQAALARGPLAYAADSSYLPEGHLLDDVVLLLSKTEPSKNVRVTRDKETDSIHLIVPTVVPKPRTGEGWWREKERYNDLVEYQGSEIIKETRMVPFFEAGNRDEDNYRDGIWPNREPVTHIAYKVWLPYQYR